MNINISCRDLVHQVTSESFQDIKKRIDTQREKLAKLRSMTMVRYNTNLLDEFWTLMPYQNVFEEFQKKVSALSKEKRRLSDLDIQEKAAAKAKIANSSLIPWRAVLRCRDVALLHHFFH